MPSPGGLCSRLDKRNSLVLIYQILFLHMSAVSSFMDDKAFVFVGHVTDENKDVRCAAEEGYRGCYCLIRFFFI